MVAQISAAGAAGPEHDAPGLRPGRPWPLGAHFDGQGVNFAVFSAHAEAVDLCLFDHSGEHEWACLRLPACTDQVWHGWLPAALPGLVYGFRAHGPHRPAAGLRFNAAKLLLDPHAREVVGAFEWREEHFDWPAGVDPRSGVQGHEDNARWALKARVCSDRYDWQDDRAPATALADSVFYEVHVRGMTRQHPDVPQALRGTYAGMATPAVIDHLRCLGVTALCLMPVHYALDEQRLVRAGLRNYWGYNTLAFFVPDPRHAAAGEAAAQRDEFRDMVRALHRAGIEIILDVVYNHSAESDELGPILSFRGFDNASWYRLQRGQAAQYVNVTGCGNTLNLAHPRVLQWAMDSLRYWVEDMHVDGFRFDLAVTLGREAEDFDAGAGFFDAVRQDPVLNRVKLIAEPWDIGPGGYQAGAFPVGWSEWNGRFRDGLRAWWLGHGASRGELARRLAGSSEQYRWSGRNPQAGINFICAHDGFTLADLVSYRQKHNLANGEANRDGHDDNLSTNCGVEGPSEDTAVLESRRRLRRALLASLFVAQGVPQLLSGDEIGRSQQGNNNAYCQDGPLNWLDWASADAALRDFVGACAALRRDWPQLRLPRWLEGHPDRSGVTDVLWLSAEGTPLTSGDWDDPSANSLLMCLAHPFGGAALVLLFHAGDGQRTFRLPQGAWTLLLDSAAPDQASPAHYAARAPVRQIWRHEIGIMGPAVVVLAAVTVADTGAQPPPA